MKRALLIQPGAYGDLIVCAPIAKWYADNGYKIYWPIREKFMTVLKEFNYVIPIILKEETLHDDWLRSDVLQILPMVKNYDKVINLADRGPHGAAQRRDESFEQCKYRLAEIPFEEKHNKERVAIPTSVDKPVVLCDDPEGYNIFDWYKVATKASEIYCTESSIWAFLDGIVHDITEERYLLPRNKMSGSTVSFYWKKEYLK